MHRLRLIAEHALCYAPHYIAERLGYFTDEGLLLETSFDSGPGGSWLADRLADGSADLARGGIWIPMMYRKHLEDLRLFAMLCARNPQVLIGRTRLDTFTLADLEGRRVLLPAAATSQWMFLEGVLREAGVDLTSIRFVRDLDRATMSRLWRSGFGDFYLASPPAAQAVQPDPAGAASLATLGGPVPWSVYYTSRERIERDGQLLARFNRALLRGIEWTLSRAPEQAATLLADDFPEATPQELADGIARMRADGVWQADVAIPRPALERYQRIILDYGLLDTPLPFEQIVASVEDGDAADRQLTAVSTAPGTGAGQE